RVPDWEAPPARTDSSAVKPLILRARSRKVRTSASELPGAAVAAEALQTIASSRAAVASHLKLLCFQPLPMGFRDHLPAWLRDAIIWAPGTCFQTVAGVGVVLRGAVTTSA